MPFHKLPELSYEKTALEPYISKETIEYHYNKHHQTYVDNLNKFVAESPEFAGKTLEQIIKTSTGKIFNNAAQVWNHNFYWNCMTPNSTKIPTGEILNKIEKDFGSFDEFKEKFIQSAIANFGSGWTWLVSDADNKLAIVNTSNADTPIAGQSTPLLTCDVWEHAYYIVYRNARLKYATDFFNLINWEFVASQLPK